MDTEATIAEAEFGDWCQRTSPRLYAYVRRHCSEADYVDVVAEVYLTAWRRSPTYPRTALLG